MYKKKTGSNYKRKFPAKKRSYRKKTGFITKPQLYRALNRSIETKQVSTTMAVTSFNSAIASFGDLIKLLPPVQLGTDENQRIGQTIKPVKLVIRGYVVFNTSAASLNLDATMLGARLFAFQDKTFRSYTSTTTSNYQLLDGGGTAVSFTGTPLDYVRPHNSDMFTFYADKKMKILKPYGTTANTAINSVTAITSMNNTLFHPFTITLTAKQIPAFLKYDNVSSGEYPVNFAPFLSLGYVNLITGVIDVAATALAMEFCSTLYYKDG